MMNDVGSDASCRMRVAYAAQIAQLAGVEDPRIEEAFAQIVREDFLSPPPWTTISMGTALVTRHLADIYDNVLVAIDRERGINNGEPALHAAWIDLVRPQPGEIVIHVGAGTGYYTAILSLLVQPGGRVDAFEYEADLAAQAKYNLRNNSNVSVHASSAFGRPLPKADLIYVNAGVLAPDVEWLRALNAGGRLIFPWQPHKGWGPAVLVTRQAKGFGARPLMNVGFISCSGANKTLSRKELPTEADTASIRSIWMLSDRAPDGSAVAVYDYVWFSTDDIVD
jgi:protein-L-isoaspartate(D-aspartate) O-methyltransferase